MLHGGAPENWRELEPLVDAILDAPHEQRLTLLAQLSAGDPGRQAVIEELVRQCEQGFALLDKPAAERFARLFEEDAIHIPPSLATRYAVIRERGRGGMAVVYLARDVKHARNVAVKVFRPELATVVGRERFLREIAIVAKLHHPHVVPLYDSGEEDGCLYYVMPFEEGPSLRERLNREQPEVLPASSVLSILRDIARALAYAHAHGVVHRDIKPDNVLLSGDSAMVTDFGIAKALTVADADAPQEVVTQAGARIGTPGYMAPEQVTGDSVIDHRTDIYAFGCLAYELYAGLPPFHGRTAPETVHAHLYSTPQPLADVRADVPARMAALIARCLEKDPERRPRNVSDVLAVIDEVSFSRGIGLPLDR